MIRNIFGLFSCKNQGKNGYFPVMYSNKRTGYAKDKIRKTSLDELPEAFNILKGDMSIIGPRPLLVSYLPWYTEEEKQRHDVRPGLSGLAQVNGRNSVTWEEKFSWDLKYVDRITFLGDVKIILDTVKKAFIKVEGVELNHEGNLANIRKKAVEEASVSK